MDPILYNRIADELRVFLNREPAKNEVLNAQNDYIIMQKVKDRIHAEELGVLQDQVDNLQEKLDAGVI